MFQAFRTGTVMPNQSFPDLVGPPLSMSAHLRFGCLSIRNFYWSLRDTYIKVRNVFLQPEYGKCPKILYTKVANKMAYANSVDPDQTAPGSTLFAIPPSILRNNCIKSKI